MFINIHIKPNGEVITKTSERVYDCPSFFQNPNRLERGGLQHDQKLPNGDYIHMHECTDGVHTLIHKKV